MAIEFTALASGSKGNSALVRAGGAGLLIDLGLGPRALTLRLAALGKSHNGVSAAVLTHTHGDHVQDSTLRWLARRRVVLYRHDGQHEALSRLDGYRELDRLGLVRGYDERPFLAPMGLRVEPIPLSHDGGPTFGFRVEGCEGRRSRPVAVGYLADTGCWWGEMADALADVGLLAVEFNHDVQMQLRSGRSPLLIARNLGDRGHLSNEQGAGLVGAVLERSRPGAVRHVVLLHLSEECNRPELAYDAAFSAARGAGSRAAVHVARQWSAFPHVRVAPSRRAKPMAAAGFPWEAA